MFEDPELPDFDSMSQEELIEWLEQLAKSRGDAASEFLEDYRAGDDAIETDLLNDAPTDADWSGWLDDTEPISGTEGDLALANPTLGDEFNGAMEDLPIDLSLLDQEDTAPTAALDWLGEITGPQSEEKLPDITDYRPPEAPSKNLGDLLRDATAEDPLNWLEDLAGNSAGASKAEGAYKSDLYDEVDDEYEDDETLDDLEDESLYSRRADRAQTFLEALLGMRDREAEEFSTESMAPVPDHVAPAAGLQPPAAADNSPVSRAADGSSDNLTQAFLLGDRQEDLEAWYAERLNAIAAAQAQTAGILTLPPAPPPAKAPPPGLAAAIYSARGKVEADDLPQALLDYETLLRSSAGLEWVVSDMRGLIEQDKFRRNPSVHRVLGDALMRQGHLDAAIDVYRHALSLL